jgi:hypothetical protein
MKLVGASNANSTSRKRAPSTPRPVRRGRGGPGRSGQKRQLPTAPRRQLVADCSGGLAAYPSLCAGPPEFLRFAVRYSLRGRGGMPAFRNGRVEGFPLVNPPWTRWRESSDDVWDADVEVGRFVYIGMTGFLWQRSVSTGWNAHRYMVMLQPENEGCRGARRRDGWERDPWRLGIRSAWQDGAIVATDSGLAYPHTRSDNLAPRSVDVAAGG